VSGNSEVCVSEFIKSSQDFLLIKIVWIAFPIKQLFLISCFLYAYENILGTEFSIYVTLKLSTMIMILGGMACLSISSYIFVFLSKSPSQPDGEF